LPTGGDTVDQFEPAAALLFVLPNFGVGGLERGTASLVRSARAAGLRVVVVTLTDPRVDPDLTLLGEIESSGASVRSLGLSGLDLHRHPIRLARAAWRLARVARQVRPDAIVSAILDADLSARIAARSLAVRHCTYLVSTTYDDRMRSGPTSRRIAFRWAIQVERWSHRATAHYIALTEAVAAQGRDLLRIPPDKISVIGRGVDLERFSPARRSAPGDRVSAVALGRLVRQKNHAYLVEALADAADPGIDVAVYGEGPLLDELVSLAARLGVRNLAFRGPTKDPAQVLCDADVFVVTSVVEGQSNALLEAMASACALVLSDIPVLREVAGANALYVDLSEPSSLSAALARLAAMPSAERRALGEAARRRAEANFDAGPLNERALDLIMAWPGGTSRSRARRPPG
jgi:glycosyltransferase involved in cell wall biosynthesis